LTLVSASAGFGKTTLIAEWARRLASGPAAGAVCWLSLDEAESDPARFFTYLLAALKGAGSTIGRATQAMLRNPQPTPAEALLASLINDLAKAPGQIVLILDDYHLIQALAVHEQLGFLIEHQPPQLLVVLATREDPPLPLARLRARNQVVELRQSDLEFTPVEAAEFLRQTAAVELTDADIDLLYRRTEGWVAGLQLAALSLQHPEDVNRMLAAPGEPHRFILDYLLDEVYRRQLPEVQEFLLLTSILDRLTAALCRAITGQEDSAGLLQRLERANLFLVPLDQARDWYRYHRLFGDLLRHRLQVERPELVRSLHARASRWYAANGFPADAVRHALAARDWDWAAELIVHGADAGLLQQGHLATLLDWLESFPDEYVRGNADLACELSWPLILTGQLDRAARLVNLAEQATADSASDPALPGNIAAARAHIARVRGDQKAAIELSERALALLPASTTLDRSGLSLNVGLARWYQGRLVEAEEKLADAQSEATQSGNQYVEVVASTFRARVLIARGRLREAADACRRLTHGEGVPSVIALVHYGLGRLQYEWNDLLAAEELARRGLELSQQSGGPELEAAGHVLLALVQQARGDYAAANGALEAAGPLLQQPGVSPAGHLHYLMGRIIAALAEGDLPAAAQLIEQIPEPEAAGSFPEYLPLLLARARFHLVAGWPARAAEQAQAVRELAAASGWAYVALQASALLAVATQDTRAALAILGEALARAEPEHLVRTFIDLGAPMAALLREACVQGVAAEYAGRLLAAATGEAHQTVAGGRPDRATPKPAAVEPEGPFSGRELDVLRLLGTGQTNQEIAQALFISVNTVKTHLEHIYGKLAVGNRRQAVTRARQLGLLV
jgi:LuxR family maltose regulon positive regulatory protein